MTGDLPGDTDDTAGYLLQMGVARFAVGVLEETTGAIASNDAFAAATANLSGHLKLSAKRMAALGAYHDGDDSQVRAVLEPLVSDLKAANADDLALYAAAAARQGDPAAREWAERAVAALPPTPDDESN